MRSLGFVVLLAGCGFQSAPAQVVPDPDAAVGLPDAPVLPPDAAVPPDARLCFGKFAEVCLDAMPAGDVSFAGITGPLDTGVDASCTQVVAQTGGPGLCVIAGRNVMLTNAVVAIGARPLVVIATDTMQIPGTLDASSKLAGPRRGAGSNSGICSALAIAGQDDSGGAGGGAGGGFGTSGGGGGDGDTNENGLPIGRGDGGTAAALPAQPTFPRGGCPGGRGGEGREDNPGGAGGDGGGAIYLVAGTSITISGDVFASGAGGGATAGSAGIQQGGGGGGSGGMIVLDAPAINVTGRVVANGGGGGGGGNIDGGGTPGGDGTTAAWNTRATAGIAARDAGAGAPGSAINQVGNLTGREEEGGGGGGGGGLGLIWIYGTLQNGTQISPPPQDRG